MSPTLAAAKRQFVEFLMRPAANGGVPLAPVLIPRQENNGRERAVQAKPFRYCSKTDARFYSQSGPASSGHQLQSLGAML